MRLRDRLLKASMEAPPSLDGPEVAKTAKIEVDVKEEGKMMSMEAPPCGDESEIAVIATETESDVKEEGKTTMEAAPCVAPCVDASEIIVIATETGSDVKKPASDPVCTGESVLGCYVGKRDTEAKDLLIGKVASYDPDSNLYSIVYEDGEREDMDRVQLSSIIMAEDGGGSRLKMSCRKRKLDLLVSEEIKKNLSDACDGPQGSDISDNVDSSSNSCESGGKQMDLHSSEPVVEIKVPELPCSSGDIAVPEDCIAHLFSVYNFVRSFSVQLFLSPFTLNDFVSSLTCSVHNSLLDAVHLALMKALRRHLVALSSDGSKLASKCLRYHDWALLDTLTWPVFLLEFLYVMGYIKHLGGQKFGVGLLSDEYYQLPVSVKLKILQIVCDEVVDSSDLKTELEKREGYSEESEYDSQATILVPVQTSGRRGRPRKNPTPQQQQIEAPSSNKEELLKKEGSLDVGQDGNSDECRICGMDGMLICCDGCPWAYHFRCIGLNKAYLPEGQWFCPECAIDKRGPVSARINKGARGATLFGLDLSGRQFLATCDYLLVTGTSLDAEPYHRYYNKSDVPKVLYQLESNEETAPLFTEICKGISEYWDNSLPKFDTMENSKGGDVVFSSGLVTCSSTTSPYAIARVPNVRGSNVKSVPISLRPHAYQNQYFHGEISASSAATHAVLSAEESNNSKSVDTSNPRKTAHLQIMLQMKAFASAALQFFWPSFDRRQNEIPRERCGWCISCKGASVNKKGCLLNLVAGNATKGSARSSSGLRLMNKPEDTHLPSIAVYLANMEESLQGLLDGPLLDLHYRQSWKNKLKQANDCRTLKFLLLQMEKCIRGVAMSNSWFKLLDQMDLSGGTNGANLNQRRGGGPGRKSRKRALESASDESSKELHWWRGGKLSNALLQRFALSRSFIRKAARQGGLKKIFGVSYHDSSEYPRINRQFSWRSSVEMCKSTSHLALQVRYLSGHIRWKELVPPDQIQTDGKASEADAAVYRNAVICDKRKIETKTIYALKFNNQKHLPVRVTKNILEAENNEDEGENGKLWFYENNIPLYLIKTYEEKAKSIAKPPLENGGPISLPNYERKKVQMYYDRDIFTYLFDREEKPLRAPCISCHQDVLLRLVVKCSTCQGDCHEACMLSSSAGEVMCKSCHDAHLNKIANSKMLQMRHAMPTPPSHVMTNVQKMKSAAKLMPKVLIQEEEVVKPGGGGGGVKRKRPVSGDPGYYGLRWKTPKRPNDTGMEYRLEHIVLKCKEGAYSPIQPLCCLCKKPYSPAFMYIRCEKCLQWFHADSVELEESDVSELVGFKCGKCRRKVQPKCPFVIDKSNKTINGHHHYHHHITPPPAKSSNLMIFDDPLLSSSHATVEPVEPLSLSKSNQKLSVRRAHTTLPQTNINTSQTDSEDLNDVSVSSELQWDSSSQGDARFTDADSNSAWMDSEPNYDNNDDNININNINIQFEEEEDDGFEPQTYFSFNELLAPEANNSNNAQFEDNNNQIGVVFDELLSNSVQEDDGNNQIGVVFDELLSNSVQEEDDGNNQIGSVFDELLSNSVQQEDEGAKGGEVVVVCDKCKGDEPKPNLKCGGCGLCIHSHCSPWIETPHHSYHNQNPQWKCGHCREWR